MDFARRQLEKYGWSNGKGLGKHENGISEALRPKLKRSVTGIGHDAAAEFNEHWWSALYDKAAKNVEVEEKNGKTRKIRTVDSEDFTITNSTWRINKKHKNRSDNEYSEYFVRKAVLTNDGTKVENVSESESEADGEDKKKDVFKMTDEELFKACEGRTAHKGARHGLKALGKLARIEQQEQMLLTQTKYEGYSHAKKLKLKNKEIVEDISLVDEQDEKSKNKKKKKRKRCLSNGTEANINCDLAKSEVAPLPHSGEKKVYGITSVAKDVECGRNAKKLEEQGLEIEVIYSDDGAKKYKKKKKRHLETELNESGPNDIVQTIDNVPKKKKKCNAMN